MAKKKAEPKNIVHVRRRFPKGNLGVYGTKIYGGYLDEDYNSIMNSSTKWDEFEKMSNSDTMRVTRFVTQLPLLRANWSLERKEDTPESVVMEEFILDQLFENHADTWNQRIESISEYLFDGFSLFEMIYTSKEWAPKGVKREKRMMNCWEEWAWRKPRTIEQWIFKQQKLQYVIQRGVNPDEGIYQTADIPADKLMIFSANRRGVNYAGNGIYRAAWEAWRKMQAIDQSRIIFFDRVASGVPIVKYPPEMSDADKDAIEGVLEDYRSGDASYFMLPIGCEFDLMQGATQGSVDFDSAILQYQSRIKYLGLAQFLDLGQTSVGARSVGEVHFDLFLQAAQSIANYICEIINAYAITPLLEMNWDKEKYGNEYPKLVAGDIEVDDIAELSTAFKTFVDSGIKLNDDVDIEELIRYKLELPPVNPEDKKIALEKKKNERKKEMEAAKNIGKEPVDKPEVPTIDNPEVPDEENDKPELPKEPEDEETEKMHEFSDTTRIDGLGYLRKLEKRRGKEIADSVILAFAGTFTEESRNFAMEQAANEIERIENQNDQLRKRMGAKALNFYTTYKDKMVRNVLSGQDPYNVDVNESQINKTVKSMMLEIKEAIKRGETDYANEYKRIKGEVKKAFQDVSLNFQDEDFDLWFEQIEEDINTRLTIGMRKIQDAAKNATRRAVLLNLKGKEKAGFVTTQILNLSDDVLASSIKETVNLAYGKGRDIKRDEVDVKMEIYTAVFDRNTCIECAPNDGIVHLVNDPDYIAPNPKCLGGDRCRCANLPYEE